jgi:hypothetical protein
MDLALATDHHGQQALCWSHFHTKLPRMGRDVLFACRDRLHRGHHNPGLREVNTMHILSVFHGNQYKEYGSSGPIR